MKAQCGGAAAAGPDRDGPDPDMFDAFAASAAAIDVDPSVVDADFLAIADVLTFAAPSAAAANNPELIDQFRNKPELIKIIKEYKDRQQKLIGNIRHLSALDLQVIKMGMRINPRYIKNCIALLEMDIRLLSDHINGKNNNPIKTYALINQTSAEFDNYRTDLMLYQELDKLFSEGSIKL